MTDHLSPDSQRDTMLRNMQDAQVRLARDPASVGAFRAALASLIEWCQSRDMREFVTLLTEIDYTVRDVPGRASFGPVFAATAYARDVIGRASDQVNATQREENAVLWQFVERLQEVRAQARPSETPLAPDLPIQDEASAARAAEGEDLAPPSMDVFSSSTASAELTDDERELIARYASSTLNTAEWPAQEKMIAPPADGTSADLDAIPPEIKRQFVLETTEDLQDLRALVLQFDARPDDLTPLGGMAQIAHKIKGTAGTLEYDTLARLTYVAEDIIKSLRSRKIPTGPEAAGVLMRALELLFIARDDAAAEHDSDPALVNELAALHHALEEYAASSEAAPASRDASLPATFSPAVREERETTPPSLNVESSLRIDIRRLNALMRSLSGLAINRAGVMQQRAEVLRLQGELAASLAHLAELATQISDTLPTYRNERMSTGDWMPHHPDVAAIDRPGWDVLELERYSDFDHTVRAFAEVVADVDTTSRAVRASMRHLAQISETQASLATQLQREVLELRLIPLRTAVFESLQVEVRRMAADLKKHITFTITGEETQIDRNISESLKEPLRQLLRNAVVHGIESTAERLAAGKSPTGSIWMQATYSGSEVVIEIGDDGRGINPHKLLASAIAAGIIDGETARNMSPADAYDLMFTPGVTTIRQAEIVGGRGIGLDEVRTQIRQLKGSVSVRSEPNHSTVFRVRVPISLSLVHALHVMVSGHQFAVPFGSVHSTHPVSPTDILTTIEVSESGDKRPVERRRMRIEHGIVQPAGDGFTSASYEEIPVFSLGELLGMQQVVRPLAVALVVEVGRHRAAVLVDEVLDDLDLVVQALPHHLRRKAIRGATVTPDGTLALLLDLVELLADVVERKRRPPVARPLPQPAAIHTPRVLVVDDSATLRRSLEFPLIRAGFAVQLAKDGIEALDMMLQAAPQAVLLDIEMPRLDGFELLSIIRSTPQLAQIPVVMLTSRAAEKHQQYAANLGANAYLIKPCPFEVIIETIHTLIKQASVHAHAL